MTSNPRSKVVADIERASETTIFNTSFTANILDRIHSAAASLQQQSEDNSPESVTEKKT
jgi:hypothetical protein